MEEIHKETPLLPADPIQKAKIRGFCEVINSAIHPYQNLRVLQKIEADFKGDKIEWATHWVQKGFATLE